MSNTVESRVGRLISLLETIGDDEKRRLERVYKEANTTEERITHNKSVSSTMKRLLDDQPSFYLIKKCFEEVERLEMKSIEEEKREILAKAKRRMEISSLYDSMRSMAELVMRLKTENEEEEQSEEEDQVTNSSLNEEEEEEELVYLNLDAKEEIEDEEESEEEDNDDESKERVGFIIKEFNNEETVELCTNQLLGCNGDCGKGHLSVEGLIRLEQLFPTLCKDCPIGQNHCNAGIHPELGDFQRLGFVSRRYLVDQQ